MGDKHGEVPTELPADGIASNSSTVAMAVRHAQDVKYDESMDQLRTFAVRVEIFLRRATEPPTIQTYVELPSGVLAVGDADRVDEVAVQPGRYEVSLLLEPRDHAERLVAWVVPA